VSIRFYEDGAHYNQHKECRIVLLGSSAPHGWTAAQLQAHLRRYFNRKSTGRTLAMSPRWAAAAFAAGTFPLRNLTFRWRGQRIVTETKDGILVPDVTLSGWVLTLLIAPSMQDGQFELLH